MSKPNLVPASGYSTKSPQRDALNQGPDKGNGLISTHRASGVQRKGNAVKRLVARLVEATASIGARRGTPKIVTFDKVDQHLQKTVDALASGNTGSAYEELNEISKTLAALVERHFDKKGNTRLEAGDQQTLKDFFNKNLKEALPNISDDKVLNLQKKLKEFSVQGDTGVVKKALADAVDEEIYSRRSKARDDVEKANTRAASTMTLQKLTSLERAVRLLKANDAKVKGIDFLNLTVKAEILHRLIDAMGDRPMKKQDHIREKDVFTLRIELYREVQTRAAELTDLLKGLGEDGPSLPFNMLSLSHLDDVQKRARALELIDEERPAIRMMPADQVTALRGAVDLLLGAPPKKGDPQPVFLQLLRKQIQRVEKKRNGMASASGDVAAVRGAKPNLEPALRKLPTTKPLPTSPLLDAFEEDDRRDAENDLASTNSNDALEAPLAPVANTGLATQVGKRFAIAVDVEPEPVGLVNVEAEAGGPAKTRLRPQQPPRRLNTQVSKSLEKTTTGTEGLQAKGLTVKTNATTSGVKDVRGADADVVPPGVARTLRPQPQPHKLKGRTDNKAAQAVLVSEPAQAVVEKAPQSH